MTQAERDALADKLISVKEYTNEYLTDAAMLGKIVLSKKSPFILVSVDTRDAVIAALRAVA